MNKKNFKPYAWQKRQLQKFRSTLGTKRPNHIVIAPRQVGKTTMIAAYILWYALLYDNKCICLLSYNKAAAIEILRIIREMYIDLPKILQLDAKVWTKDCVHFVNDTRITIGNCQATSSIRGRAFDLIVVDDAANISDKDFNNFMKSVFPIQTCKPDGQMIFITTQYKNSKFHELYEYAIARGDNCSFNATHLKCNCV